ncbi:MAG: hypothetical protein ABJE66_25365 [Deltaproteobacteria bacterium]
MRLAFAAVMLLGCAGTPKSSRPYAEPKVDDIVARLAKARGELTSFRADSTMDYWLGNQRAKGEVLVMGSVGAKVRFAALSPAGGSSMAEMACDGSKFVYIDYQNNCTISGPCDQRSIAQFFHIELAPDDFLHLAVGTPPMIANPTGTVTWDANRGVETVELKSADGTEKLVIDMRDNHFDVLDAELVGADGKTRWSVANSDFVDVKGHRVPNKSQFKSPDNKQDLLVDWGAASARDINLTIPATSFEMAPPQGLGQCGGGAPASTVRSSSKP